jgi:hypothetical protein
MTHRRSINHRRKTWQAAPIPRYWCPTILPEGVLDTVQAPPHPQRTFARDRATIYSNAAYGVAIKRLFAGPTYLGALPAAGHSHEGLGCVNITGAFPVPRLVR